MVKIKESKIKNLNDYVELIEKEDYNKLRHLIIKNENRKEIINELMFRLELPERFITLFAYFADRNLLIMTQQLSDELKLTILKCNNSLSNLIYEYQKLSEEFIEKNIDIINFKMLALNCEYLSEDFIRKHKDKFSMYILSNRSLSEDFIREFQDKIDWLQVSCSSKLSEDFIREFQDKVSWKAISASQSLSEDFIEEFKDKLKFNNLAMSRNIDEKILEKYIDRIDEFAIKFGGFSKETQEKYLSMKRK